MEIVKKNGSGLYAGIAPKLIQTILYNAFLMITYEKLRRFIKAMLFTYAKRRRLIPSNP
eukprot:CAMPEP_0170548744 /NCGR_PEP_ID=MMETSP0211-20121228/6955_1 /TAXON_ID=311385 /ORGANISM="Pseudokeronopsis sp., Strain OXSARD2" /LENGTH=58 /DNA_ID=CAMNT_0010854371 /DNA_START=747 /DNA_END=923 /DNA_ORIENTATION=+